jgi:hypothetical protein
MNKKGAEMTIGTIVIIVLALIVLVVVALGFTTGWRNLWDKVNIFGGGATLGAVGQACQIACSSEDINGFCKQPRIVSGVKEQQSTSGSWSYTLTSDAKDKAKTPTCNDLVTMQAISVGDCKITC